MTDTATVDTDEIYAKVDIFIKRIHEKDIALNQKAQTIIEEKTTGKDYLGRIIKKSFSLADLIVEEMSAYQELKNTEAKTKAFYDNERKNPDSNVSFLMEIDLTSAIRRKER